MVNRMETLSHPEKLALNRNFPGWKNHLANGPEAPLPYYRVVAYSKNEQNQLRILMSRIPHAEHSVVLIDEGDGIPLLLSKERQDEIRQESEDTLGGPEEADDAF